MYMYIYIYTYIHMYRTRRSTGKISAGKNKFGEICFKWLSAHVVNMHWKQLPPTLTSVLPYPGTFKACIDQNTANGKNTCQHILCKIGVMYVATVWFQGSGHI